MSGFVLLHRDALEHPLLKDVGRLGAWFWMVSKACWKPTKFDVLGKTITLQRGQFCCSLRELGDGWGWSKSTVDRFLSRLKSEGMIETDSGTGRLVITICNYAKYQDISDSSGTGNDTETGWDTTRTTPVQKPGHDQHASKPQKTAVFEGSESEGWDTSGTRAGHERDIKEQRNKGTIERESKASLSPRVKKAGQTDDDLFGGKPPEPKLAKPKKSKPKIHFDLPEWVPPIQWAAYLEMRAKKGSTPTEHAMQLLVGKLDKFRREGSPPGDVLDQSTVNNWTDVYHLKDRSNEHRTGSNQTGSRNRYEPDGAMAYMQRKIGIGGNSQPARAAGRDDDGEPARGYALPHP